MSSGLAGCRVDLFENPHGPLVLGPQSVLLRGRDARAGQQDGAVVGCGLPDRTVNEVVVTCGQRELSHSPVSGAAADLVPASLRHSAFAGSSNQQ
jgi:hypothetical protein